MTPADEDALADIFAARVAEHGLNDLYPERDEHRPLDDYPWTPPRTCYWSAWALAHVYPELVVVYGELVLIHNGDVARTSHAWNTRADGGDHRRGDRGPVLPVGDRRRVRAVTAGGETR